MNFKNGKIKIDNTDAYYIKFGKGSKKLIIITGVGDGFKVVKGLAMPFSIMYREFGHDYEVYIFSRRNNLPNNFSIYDMANDIINHMSDLKIDKASIVGISQGGMIAQHIALNAPEKVDQVVLVVTLARTNEIMNDSIGTWIEMAKNKDYKNIMIDNAKRSYTGKALNKYLKLYKFIGRFDKKTTYDRFIIEANACLNHNTFNRLNEIKAKTLVIGADKDLVLGSIGSDELAKYIPNCELYIYDEYSHGVYEQAKDFNKRVLEFLKK